MSILINPYAFGPGGGGGPGPTPWTPGNIGAALALWLDADDAGSFTLTGSDIDQWNDKSGNARHATPPTATKPTRTASGINSKGSVVFSSGTDPLLTSSFAAPAAADGLLCALVARRAGEPVNFSVPLNFGAVNAQWSLFWASNLPALGVTTRNRPTFRNVSGQEAVAPAQSMVSDTDYLWAGRMSNADITQYLHGAALTGSAGAATRNLGGSAALTIGASPQNSYADHRFQGQLAEIVVVHADITDTTRQKLEGYLAWKWGLVSALPGGHPYKSAAPTVS